MNPLETNQLRNSSVYRFISDGLERTTKAFESSSTCEDRDAWRLLNYCFRLKQLADRRNAIGNQPLNNSNNVGLAAECHELLDALLESIGLHSYEKHLVIENLALRLRSAVNPGNFVLANKDRDATEILEIHNVATLVNTSISGVVLEHFDETVVIRFNVAGEAEEREFLWNDLNCAPETLPVGTLVIGETKLLRAPTPPSEEEQDAEFQKARDQILRDLKSLGIDPKAMIGSEDTAELREKSARVWAENLKKPYPTQSDGG